MRPDCIDCFASDLFNCCDLCVQDIHSGGSGIGEVGVLSTSSESHPSTSPLFQLSEVSCGI